MQELLYRGAIIKTGLEQAESRRILQPHSQKLLLQRQRGKTSGDGPQHPPPSEEVTRIVRSELEAMGPTAFYSRSSDATPASVPLVVAIVLQEFENIVVHSVTTSRVSPSATLSPKIRFSPRYHNTVTILWFRPQDKVQLHSVDQTTK